MKVLLAGFNIDTAISKQLTAKGITATPESISAAYARISRSPKSVDILRKEAREEVVQARQSNRRIIFEMGHHSIAEHAVFNFDIIGISRRAVEELEKFRLCSYTEKSQRYVTLKGDFVIPEELRKSRSLLDEYMGILQDQNSFYRELFERIQEHARKKSPEGTRHPIQQRLLENSAKEDARYILSMATQTQLGATINARNLELMMRRCASHSLEEMRELGERFYALVKKIAPSIILFWTANDYDARTYTEVQQYANRVVRKSNGTRRDDVALIDYTHDADTKILTALLFRTTHHGYAYCKKVVKGMSHQARIELFKKACQYMELYDVALREFEYANLTYSLLVSAACFGQLKRHRIATITCQDYDPRLGFTIPESVREVGAAQKFSAIIRKTEDVFRKIEKKSPGIGAYILTNAHRKGVLLGVNLRELYHISRLREDPTAQWDIRGTVHRMADLARKVMPITAQLLGSKQEFVSVYHKLYGKTPRITTIPKLM